MSYYKQEIHEVTSTNATVQPGDLIPVEPNQNTAKNIKKIEVKEVKEQADGTQKIVTETTEIDDSKANSTTSSSSVQDSIEAKLEQEKLDRKRAGDPVAN